MINAAAVSGHVTVNLGNHHATIDGRSIDIDPTTRVTKVFTGDGDDSIIGDASDNALLAGRGNNTIDGGGGTDTALFIGSRADCTVGFSSGGTFTAGTLSHDTFDTTVHIEKAAFSEGTLCVQAASDTGLGIAALYNGLLFRNADGGGYGYWTTEAANGASLGGIGANFLASTEFADGAGMLDNAAFIDEVYQNLLHRAPDAGGAAYRSAELASGALTRAGLVISIDHYIEYQTTQLTGVFAAINELGNVWS
ncbi:MAG: DUF4214 domain-containing protein [Reyranella sp.]|uniref:DUF4214 domain-containing protein n=1 Tax=Reyranella sp. TaxID=1929291 RepID=UPI003D132938